MEKLLAIFVGAVVLSMALASKKHTGMSDQQSSMGSLTRKDAGATLLQDDIEFISSLYGGDRASLLLEKSVDSQQMCTRDSFNVIQNLQNIIGVVISVVQNWMIHAVGTVMGGGQNNNNNMGGGYNPGASQGGYFPGGPGGNPGGPGGNPGGPGGNRGGYQGYQGGYQPMSFYSSKAEMKSYASIRKLHQLKKKVENMKQKCLQTL